MGQYSQNPRQRGRPRIQETAEDIVASVLATAGPRVSNSEFSTRSVSQLTGLSQPVVSRAFRTLRNTVTAAAAPPDGGWLQLSEVRVEFPRLLVRCQPAPDTAAASQPPLAPRAFLRRATAFFSVLRASGAAFWPRERHAITRTDPGESSRYGMGTNETDSHESHPHETDPETDQAAGASTGSAAGSSAGPSAGPAAEACSADRTETATWDASGGQDWEAFCAKLASLLSRCRPELDSIPGELLRELAARVSRGLHGLTWHRHMSAQEIHQISDSKSQPMHVPEFPTARLATASDWLPHSELSVTEQISIALRKHIMNAGFRPGDRLTPQPLASQLGLSLSTVRSAMRRLADDGLLSYTGHVGYSIPRVTGDDVIDLYASRLQVGAVLLRGCSAQPRHRLLPARQAMRSLEAAAEQGSTSDVGQADLYFQQELADCAGLPQSARAFHALTLRIRMFIAVLQLDYSPAADRLLLDDRRIMRAVSDGDAGAAIRTWRSKVDNAVRHMSALAPEAFDAQLWSRLSASAA